jgi:2-keto-3-deoxy-L-rhamnonate aldolase RhmA
MNVRLTVAVAGVSVLAGLAAIEAAKPRINPMVDLLAAKQPVFGLYAPSARVGRGGQRPGAPGAAATPPATPAPPPPPAKTPMDLAKETLAQTGSDFIFDGSMEGGVDRGIAAYSEFVTALSAEGLLVKTPSPHLSQALVVKMQEIGTDVAKATDAIGKELNAGVTTIMFTGTESAAEVEAGIKAMRFTSKGGTRDESSFGIAPKIWGLSDGDYKKKADLWPLNKDGELVNWTIVESKPGLAHVREIAAVKGIGVLWPGAGTLRGVMSDPKLGPDGKPEIGANGRPVMVPNPEAWEKAIQQVLSACKEFKVACGFPSNTPEDMEMRYKQGFRVFVASWGENGFKMVKHGREISGRK